MAITKVSPSVVENQVVGRKNLIINGAMRVAQRSTSSTGSGDYVLDRFYQDYNGGTVTYAQSSLSSSDTPYSHGFRKSIKLTNTSTGSDAANNYVRFQQRIEAQNLSNSGWNYTSDTSFVTLSFWAKSSLAGTYTISLKNIESSASEDYAFEFTLTANTWKKVTHAIKGNSEIVFDNDSGEGLRVEWFPYLGTTFTTSSKTLETWGAYLSSAQGKDYGQNWSATASATFEVTGVQLEVGDRATPFEHRSFDEDLILCQRYYQELPIKDRTFVQYSSTDYAYGGNINYWQPMRAAPTVTGGANADVYPNGAARITTSGLVSLQSPTYNSSEANVYHTTLGNSYTGYFVRSDNLKLSAELV